MRKFILVFLCGVSSFAQAKSNFVFSNLPGPHGVGFHIVKQYDFTRGFKGNFDELTGQPIQGEKARPIQTLVWYPAETGGIPLSYTDYLRSRVTEEAFDLTDENVDKLVAKTKEGMTFRLGDNRTREELAARMTAVRDAKPVSDKFPVIIYAPGSGGTADENADLFEYLASHGYVVIASTSMGVHAKAMVHNIEDVEAQVGDIEFLIGYAQTLPQSDMAHVAVAGWSWGGMTNVFAAARDSRITALVSFDGTREPSLTKLAHGTRW